MYTGALCERRRFLYELRPLMTKAINNKSMEFFETQFQRQVRDKEYTLNPFEILALDYIKGSVLDLGSGLGNLSLEAGRRGCHVLAVDYSPTAITRINAEAQSKGLPVHAIEADLSTWNVGQQFDTIIAIGLLMFFRQPKALELLSSIQSHINSGGHAIVNVLTEGTSFMGMFDPVNYYLFGVDELEERFNGWTILVSKREGFPAPGGTCKNFSTVIARKP